MRKTLLITSCAAAISAFATVGAFAQTSQTGPTSAQTQASGPSIHDASKSGSPAAQGAMNNDSTTGMSNSGMSKSKKMSRDKMSKDKMMKKDNMGK